MQCLHCIRGNSQRLDMSREVINKVFSQVTSVGCLMLTGGEPSLACGVIETIIEHIHMRKTDVQNFWCITNGLAGRQRAERFAMALTKLHWLCGSDEDGMSGLSVSSDAWHEDVAIPAVYEKLKFYQERRHGPQSQDAVILEGRAKLNGIGRREAKSQGSFDVEEFDGNMHIGGDLYVAANGNVTSECDMSFSRIDAESLGNVLTDSIEDIVKRWEAKNGQEVGERAECQ